MKNVCAVLIGCLLMSGTIAVADTIVKGDLRIQDGGDLVFSDGSVQSKAQVQGPKGDKGDKGETGMQGQGGLNSLVLLTDINPGSLCPHGGVIIQSGLDLNRDGILASTEVTQTKNLCSGTSVATYSLSDLAGTWYAAGIKTSIKNTNNPSNFGYDIDRMVIDDKGAYTYTTISTSDLYHTNEKGQLSINSDGVVSTGYDNDYMFLNSSKDVMYEFFADAETGEQQLFIYLKRR
jgi:hypothetical protein